MTDLATLQLAGAVLGPLIGAGAGSYFGIKSSLNGLKERSLRMENSLTDIRDHARDTLTAVKQHEDNARIRAANLQERLG